MKRVSCLCVGLRANGGPSVAIRGKHLLKNYIHPSGGTMHIWELFGQSVGGLFVLFHRFARFPTQQFFRDWLVKSICVVIFDKRTFFLASWVGSRWP